MIDYTKEELIKFENEMAARFDNAEIKAPVHLRSREFYVQES